MAEVRGTGGHLGGPWKAAEAPRSSERGAPRVVASDDGKKALKGAFSAIFGTIEKYVILIVLNNFFLSSILAEVGLKTRQTRRWLGSAYGFIPTYYKNFYTKPAFLFCW